MKTLKFADREEWLKARLGKITGTRLGAIVVKRGTGRKIGFYELIAERLATPPDGEDPMARGLRLQDEALDRFEEAAKKKVNRSLRLWAREDNPAIALSPDGTIGQTEAVEVKCLSSARHLEALIERKIPAEYVYQTLQYFVVRDTLKTLHVVFYDPRIPSADYFELTLKREELAEKIEETLEYERRTIQEVEEIVKKISKF